MNTVIICVCALLGMNILLLKFKGNLSKKVTKNLQNMNAFSKTKSISGLDTSRLQGCVIYLTYFLND
jgi:hypothetical protein